MATKDIHEQLVHSSTTGDYKENKKREKDKRNRREDKNLGSPEVCREHRLRHRLDRRKTLPRPIQTRRFFPFKVARPPALAARVTIY